jgi:hypothetical protein
MILLIGGCAGQQTRLELHDNSGDGAIYEFREVLWRPQNSGVEVVGYGVLPFDNSRISIDYNPHWPTSGFVIIRMHGRTQPDGRFALTILGPAKELGPGDDEVLRGTADSVSAQTIDDRTRRIDLRDMPIQSRNRPDVRFTLSGPIIAVRADDDPFEKELRRFRQELGYRHPPETE